MTPTSSTYRWLNETDCILANWHKGPGIEMPMHLHEEFEIHYLWNCKKAVRVVGDHKEVIHDKDLILLGPRLLHTHLYDEESIDVNQRDFFLHGRPNIFDKEYLSKSSMLQLQSLFQRGEHGLSFSEPTIAKVEPIINGLMEGEHLSQPRLLLKLLEILLIMAEDENCNILSYTSSSFHYSEREDRINRSLCYIKSNYDKKIRVKDVADIMGLSNERANKNFKQAMMRSIIDYVIEYRLSMAVNQLMVTDKTVAEIAYSVGFDNIPYFNRAFRRKYYCSPIEFRKRHIVRMV